VLVRRRDVRLRERRIGPINTQQLTKKGTEKSTQKPE
jgi:hypothetical protein